MRELAGWEWLLGGALAVWLLWRLRNTSVTSLERSDRDEPGQGNDWWGLLLPLAAVVVFVLLLIASLRR